MKDKFTKQWIIDNSLEIIDRYEKGILTLRALHYQLVSIGMTNSINHYKRVVNAMISARWDNLVSFDTFSDLDREMVGTTWYKETDVESSVNTAQDEIRAWMEYYSKNRWENQEYYPEVFIEKKALQGVFEKKCRRWRVALGACKGYPSLTFLHEAYQRFSDAESEGKTPIIIYFGDYDPSGEDIPRAIKENLWKMGVDLEVKRVALMENQVIEMNLPPAPTKSTDTRTAKWDGLGQVELDAVRPEKLMDMLEDALNDIFDQDKYEELKEEEEKEQEEYRTQLKEFVKTL